MEIRSSTKKSNEQAWEGVDPQAIRGRALDPSHGGNVGRGPNSQARVEPSKPWVPIIFQLFYGK
jgi:hypothetical protein